MIFLGKIIEGKFIPDYLPAYLEYFQKNEGKKVKQEIVRIFGRRSNAQNRYVWGVQYKLIAERLTELNAGIEVTPEQVHIIMSEKFNSLKLKLATGDELSVVESTSDMTTVQFSERCKNIQQWAAMYLGLNIPDPQEMINDFEGLQALREE